MAGRIRTIKPELREHLQFASLTDRAARLFLMLFTIADDEGRCPASPAYLAGNVFFARPCAPNAIGKALAELETADLIKPYAVNGAPFLEIVGWRSQSSVVHQRIEKPQPGRFPAPEWFHSRNDSGNDSRTDSGTDQYLDQRPGPVPGPGPGSLRAKLEAVLSTLPPGPGGLRPLAGGAAVTAMRERVDSNELTVESCSASVLAFYAFREEKKLALNGQSHLEKALAKWIRSEGNKPTKESAKKTLKQKKPKTTKKQKQNAERETSPTPDRAMQTPRSVYKEPPPLPSGFNAPEGRWWTPMLDHTGTGGGGWAEFNGRTFVRDAGVNLKWELTREGIRFEERGSLGSAPGSMLVLVEITDATTSNARGNGVH